MTVQSFLALLGEPLNAATLDDDTFAVLVRRPPPKDLGFISRSSTSVSVSVNGHEFAINQSPQLLNSHRPGGTTGAVVWSLAPHVASFLGSPTSPLATHGILNPQSTVLELGSGVSPAVALSLAAAPATLRPARVILSDQEYVVKLMRQNLEHNLHAVGHWEIVKDEVRPPLISYRILPWSAGKKGGRGSGRLSKPQAESASKPGAHAPLTIDITSLDWEKDSLQHHPVFTQHPESPISLVIIVDCVYNESLIPHLVETSVDACSISSVSTTNASQRSNLDETLVLIALEIRSPEVLDCFLEEFAKYFRVWRVPDSVLSKELRTGADSGGEEAGTGYVVYCGVLRDR